MTYLPAGLPPLCTCGSPWMRPKTETVGKNPYTWRVTWTCAKGWHDQTVTLVEKGEA